MIVWGILQKTDNVVSNSYLISCVRNTAAFSFCIYPDRPRSEDASVLQQKIDYLYIVRIVFAVLLCSLADKMKWRLTFLQTGSMFIQFLIHTFRL